MKRKNVSFAVISVALISISLISASASSLANTPLYVFRMEQVSDKMNFLPTEVNGFIYSAEKGYTLTYNVAGCCSVVPLSTQPGDTYCLSCPETCDETCPWTCFETCGSTCEGHTCDQTSCQPTCVTCDQPTCSDTCWYTCDDPTCRETCGHTCRRTCE